jgi:hypothetical protein
MKLGTICLSMLLALPAFAGIAGKWDVVSTTADGEKIKSVLTVTQADGKSDATLAVGTQNIPLQKIDIAAEAISFRLDWGGTGITVKAKLDGDKLAGNWTADSGETGPVAATRIAEAAAAGAGSNAFYTGKWKLTAARPGGDPIKVDLELKEDAGKWSGTLTTPDGMAIPATVVMDSGNLTVTIDAGSATYVLKLAKNGEGMKGTAAGPDGGALELTAVR